MKKFDKQIIIAGLIVVILCLYSVLLLQLINHRKVALGVKVADFRLGGQNLTNGEKTLQNKWDKFNDQNIVLTYQNQTWPVKLTDLGFQINLSATLNRAYEVGRHASHLVDIEEQLIALTGRYNFTPSYQIEAKVFQSETEGLFKDIETPAQNATLVYKTGLNDFSVTSSSQGVVINRKKLLADLSKNIKTFSHQPIVLELINEHPLVTEDETEEALEKARSILAHQPYQLIFEKEKWLLDRKELIEWLIFEAVPECVSGTETVCQSDNKVLGLSLDRDKIKDYLTEISKSINHEPANAVLKIEGQRAVVFEPGKDGFELKIEPTIEQIEKSILGDEPKEKIQIVADTALSEILLKDTNRLGINALIGQGVSNFAGSPSNRIHNIKVGAARLNGLILEPGQEFSFLGFLGEVGPAQGYLPELVIKPGEVVPEYGGGLCQVSTTVFRAAVNSGLEITQRRPHAFPVQYYNPQGFDATVYDPSPDLRFINNTPGHILIQSYVRGTYLYFNFYGTDDGRKVTVKGPYVLVSNPDGSMKTNLIQQVVWPSGQTTTTEFFSAYKSPALYHPETDDEKSSTTPAQTE